MASIAFIGLGHMGKPMVANLVKAGHVVRVFDISEEAMHQSQQDGGRPCESVKTAVIDADVVFTMLQTGEQVHKVCLDEEGIFATIKTGALYLDTSSIAVSQARALHEKAKTQQIAMCDAPVSGGVSGAENGALTIMVGGSDAHFNLAKPYLQILGKRIIHAGAPGTGQAAKICNNLILGISMIAVSEAFNLAEKTGLGAKKLFEISSQASGQCWAMTSYCPVPGIIDHVPSNQDYEAGFMSQMMLKDLCLSQTAAKNNQVQTPLGAQATALYQRFVDEGNGELDFSAIINMLKV